ncbi:MAG: hypothetical protein M0027_11925 [Candidatus Dormibacteraeota bacterium]|jgi:hypothetical protein|nr:hypothetical protein [Candidatus Dormibacteraeota bacterium]
MSKDLRRPRSDNREEDDGSRERCQLPWWAMMPGGRPPEGWERPARKVRGREAER